MREAGLHVEKTPSAKCGGYGLKAKVWIKVCNVHSVAYLSTTLQPSAFPKDEDSILEVSTWLHRLCYDESCTLSVKVLLEENYK